MSDRVILHCDLNNFYASVACLDNPTVKNFPVGVGGNEKERHGIILAKNYLAKEYGIKTGETIISAKQKCPDLIIVPPNFRRQNLLSRRVREIYKDYTSLIEPFGIDECWLDVTGSILLYGSGEELADIIRKRVKKEVGLTISVGVSFTKVFAKLGSDLKKPDAVTVIAKDNFKEKIWGLSVGELLGIGRKTAEKLRNLGIFTIGDLANCHPKTLENVLGKNGLKLSAIANGNDDAAVKEQDYEDTPKSVGRSTTAAHDLSQPEQIYKTLLFLSESVATTLKKKGLKAGGIQVQTRTNTLVVHEFQTVINNPTSSALVIARQGMDLIYKNYDFLYPLRSVGIRAIKLKRSEVFQSDIFGDSISQIKNDMLEEKIVDIRDKFGADSLKRARVVNETEPIGPDIVFGNTKAQV